MDSIIIQYILIGIVVLGACYSIFKMLRKNFSPKKFDTKGGDCNKNCGCS